MRFFIFVSSSVQKLEPKKLDFLGAVLDLDPEVLESRIRAKIAQIHNTASAPPSYCSAVKFHESNIT
jgi:hypothetical protein